MYVCMYVCGNIDIDINIYLYIAYIYIYIVIYLCVFSLGLRMLGFSVWGLVYFSAFEFCGCKAW